MGQARDEITSPETPVPGLARAARERPGQRPASPVMLVPEIAARLGIVPATFNRTWRRMHVEDGLPPPLTRHRPYRFNRVKMEAWLNRDRAAVSTQAPANDAAPVVAQSDAEHRAQLAAAYAPPGAELRQ